MTAAERGASRLRTRAQCPRVRLRAVLSAHHLEVRHNGHGGAPGPAC